jgi:hypothetical protein
MIECQREGPYVQSHAIHKTIEEYVRFLSRLTAHKTSGYPNLGLAWIRRERPHCYVVLRRGGANMRSPTVPRDDDNQTAQHDADEDYRNDCVNPRKIAGSLWPQPWSIRSTWTHPIIWSPTWRSRGPTPCCRRSYGIPATPRWRFGRCVAANIWFCSGPDASVIDHPSTIPPGTAVLNRKQRSLPNCRRRSS